MQGVYVVRRLLAFDTGGVVFATPNKHVREIVMNTDSEITAAVGSITSGSLDGTDAGDNDMEYRFGRRPSARAPFPFTAREFARLLVLRGRIRDDRYATYGA